MISCLFEDCDRGKYARGLCKAHYEQSRKGRPLASLNKKDECKFPDCGRRIKANGLCPGHDAQRRSGRELSTLRNVEKRGPKCTVEECYNDHEAKGFCAGHYRQIRRTGSITSISVPKKNLGYIDKKGYRHITVDGKRYLEHRYVMQEFLGRELLPNETVHHKNGNKLDNTISNLELWPSSHPAGQRVQDLVSWAKEILDLYSDDSLRLEMKNNAD